MLGVMPDELTVKYVDKYMNAMQSPDVKVSCIDTAAIVPQDPVDVGNEMISEFVPDVGLEPEGAGKFVVLFAYSTRVYPLPTTSENVGVVLNQNGEVVDATSCQVTPPSTTVPPGATFTKSGCVPPLFPFVVATKIRFVPVPCCEYVLNAVGMMYCSVVYAVDAAQMLVV
jgi:hypothetical protein